MAKVLTIPRKFEIKKNGENITLDDPNPNFTLEEVQKFYASEYPEITNANFGEPEVKNDVQVFSISTVTGTKG